MNTTDAERVRQIFDAAADLHRDARADFVKIACQGNAALESEVTSLLRSLDTRWTSDMDTAIVAFSEDADRSLPPSDTLPAANIAGFRLRRVIGRGAMGVVCEAEQDVPKRLVAIKVLSAWNAGRDLRRRFVAEAEILARLDHPGIARVIAAGTYDLGISETTGMLHNLLGSSPSVPWLAMELVEGARTLTAFAREQSLSIRAKIELFALVCDAVHAGHLMGVIHRDLKPANVLVNSAGHPKIIDYGVARAMSFDRQLSAHATATAAAPFIGTLAYMSPEQVDGRGQHADVRSDVYALGVMLYELTTGRLPHAPDPQSFAESARLIGTAAPKSPRSIAPEISSDLDTIILKALEKEPDARYQSAADFADDLRRVLTSRPVRARRPSASYALRMWIRRHPARAALVSLAILGVLVGVVGVSVGLARESAARALADRQGRLANLVAADYALRVGDAATAKSCLDAVPPSLRGWEWSYLVTRTDTSTSTIDLRPLISSGGVAQLTPRPDVVLALHDDRVQAFDVKSRSALWTASCAPSRSNVIFSTSGRSVLVPGVQDSVLLDVDTGNVLARCVHPRTGLAFGGAVDPTGRSVAVVGEAFVAQYDARTGTLLRHWPVNGSVYGVAFDSKGDRIAWSDASAIIVADAHSGSEVLRLPTSRRTIWEPSFLKWSADDRFLICTSDSELEVFDTSTSEPHPVRTLSAGAQRITFIDFTADSRFILAASKDSTVRVWTVATGELVRTLIGHEHSVNMALATTDPTGSLSVQSVDSENVLREWAFDPSRSPNTIVTAAGPGGGFVGSLTWNRDTNCIVSGTYGGTFEYHPCSPDSKSPPLHLSRTLNATATSADGTRALALSIDSELYGIDLSQGQILWHRPLTQPHDACALTTDGSNGALGSLTGTLTMINPNDGSERHSATGRNVRISRMRFTSRGDSIVLAYDDGALELWNVNRTERLRVIHPETPGSLAAFALSADDQWIAYASAGKTGEIKIERLLTGANQQTFEPIGTMIWSLAFNPDGTRLAVGGQDRQTRILELPSGQQFLRLRDHQGSVMTLAWSTDGKTLLSGGHDQRICIYSTDSEPALAHPPPSSRSGR